MMMTTMMTMTTIVKTTMTNVIPLNFLFDVGISYIFYLFKIFVSSIIFLTHLYQAFPNGDSWFQLKLQKKFQENSVSFNRQIILF